MVRTIMQASSFIAQNSAAGMINANSFDNFMNGSGGVGYAAQQAQNAQQQMAMQAAVMDINFGPVLDAIAELKDKVIELKKMQNASFSVIANLMLMLPYYQPNGTTDVMTVKVEGDDVIIV